MSEQKRIEVGQPVWISDMNTRPGNWRESTVKTIGTKYITTVSGDRFELVPFRGNMHRGGPNSGPGVHGAIFTQEAYENERWMEKNHHKVTSAVDRTYDPKVLRQIADLLALTL